MNEELATNNLPPSLLERVDVICDRFEHAWLQRPRIEDYLAEVEGNEQEVLLRELLKVELEYRVKAGEPISLEQYQQRFPLHAELVAALVKECAPASGTPLPVGDSVLDALATTIPFVPRVSLRDPEEQPGTTPPLSQEAPQKQDVSNRYRIGDEIGQGGMGKVFLGHDTDLCRDIAVKVLLETHRDRTELCQRFVEEAQIGGQLQHPGIVPVYELGQFSDKRPYFTMKLIKGRTLEALLAERKDAAQDRPRFLKIFEQVCQTLAYAHARGVIHRDLKPLNIMVGAFGEVQVMDWGLAKVLAKQRGAADAPADPVLSALRTVRTGQPERASQTGMVMGTWAYMPPEQAQGKTETLDERCDVFGLGSILCVILTGEPAYRGPAQDQRRQAEHSDVADAFARLDACGADAELVDLAKRCLTEKPGDHPQMQAFWLGT
jgi:hypothetical protein